MVASSHFKLVVKFPNPFDKDKEQQEELYLRTNQKDKLDFSLLNKTVYFSLRNSVVKLYLEENGVWKKQNEWRSFFKLKDSEAIRSLDSRVKIAKVPLDNDDLKKLLANNSLFLSNSLRDGSSLEMVLSKTCKLTTILIKG